VNTASLPVRAFSFACLSKSLASAENLINNHDIPIFNRSELRIMSPSTSPRPARPHPIRTLAADFQQTSRTYTAAAFSLPFTAESTRNLDRLHSSIDIYVRMVDWTFGVSGPFLLQLHDELVRTIGREIRKPDAYLAVLKSVFFAVAQAKADGQFHDERVVVGYLAHTSNYNKRFYEPNLPGHAVVTDTIAFLERKELIVITKSKVDGRCSYFEPTETFPFHEHMQLQLMDARGSVKIYTAKAKEAIRKDLVGKTATGKNSYKTVYINTGHKPLKEKYLASQQRQDVERVLGELGTINRHLLRFTYAICDVDDVWRDLFVGKVMYHAVFNNSSTEQGGRNYAGVQNLAQRDVEHPIRETLHINGKPMVELDYGNLHIRMLYHQKGVDLLGDCYRNVKIPNWNAAAAVQRDLIKTLLLALPNCGSPEATPEQNLLKAQHMARSQYKEWLWETVEDLQTGLRTRQKREGRELPAGVTVKDVVDAIIAAHEAIADRLFSGAGIWLQAIDGQIARNIMLHFVQLGRPCIGIHDSFFVWPEDENLLKQLMIDEYTAVFPGHRPVVETKKKKRAYLPALDFAAAA
jgi:hypothetical protein